MTLSRSHVRTHCTRLADPLYTSGFLSLPVRAYPNPIHSPSTSPSPDPTLALSRALALNT
jgi:hypothetical protein